MSGLQTDLYELTMAAGYAAAGRSRDVGVFELSVRKLPPNRDFLIAAGLAQAAEYLLSLRFTAAEIGFLRALPVLSRAPAEFFDALRDFKFTGDVFAVPEGTRVLAGEPLMTVRAPIVESQIPETYLLSTIAFQTMIASKAVRIVNAAAGRPVIEFGTRRAHSFQAGMLAARAAYIGGCAGTSNTETGFRFSIPVYGTMAHSWVQSFPSELESFRQMQGLLGESCVHLIDTYDTQAGAEKAAALGNPLWGVRIDSGDIDSASRQVRKILDAHGLRAAKIMASGELTESRVEQLVDSGAPVDAFGVGTDLSTSADAPNLNAVYKLVEVDTEGIKRYTAKFSPGKFTLPGPKQIFRYPDHDLVGCSWECPGCPDNPGEAEALLRPVILNGRLVEPLPGLDAARKRAARTLPPSFRVEYSPELLALQDKCRDSVH